MLKNYWLIAARNMWRNKVFTLINIFGLVIGISASLVIFLVIQYAYSFERFQPDASRIYRVVSNMHFPNMDFKNSGVCGPLVPMVRSQVPGIEASTVFWKLDNVKVSLDASGKPGRTFRKQTGVVFADEHYFEFFPYQWLAGSKQLAGKEPNQVTLTESRAHAYFPNLDNSRIIGQTIFYNDSIPTKITGIVKDLGETTDFTFSEFVSFPTYLPTLRNHSGYDNWGSISSNSQFLIRLSKTARASQVQKQIADARGKATKDEYLRTDNFLQPLSDIHFNVDYYNFDQQPANKKTLLGLIAIASFLLLLGCINFINLSTAQASRRAREIGIRKTMGSSIIQLIGQFLGETVLLTVMATVLSLALVPWLIKLFSGFIPAGVHYGMLFQPVVFGFLALLTLLVSILSGLYPAIIVSRYQPALVLKNLAFASSGHSRKARLRKILTVSQFAIAQFFIIATLIVGRQISYSINMDMGFKKEAIVNFSVPMNYDHPDQKPSLLLERLKSIPGIASVSLAGNPPASIGGSVTTMKFVKDGKTIETTVEIKDADTAFIHLYHLKLLAGRNLEESDTTREYLANETYARFLGFKDPKDIVGKYVENNHTPIVGLLADFHVRSTQSPIKPLVLTCHKRVHSGFHILLSAKGENTDRWKRTLSEVEKAYKNVYPDQEFSYTFFDESIAKFYDEEQQTSRLLNWSAGLAVFISCMGLFGLVIFTTTQRMKEIGVRKVLGATVVQLVNLLSRDYLKLVLIAFVISAPLSWWAMKSWLNNYAYRTTMSWWIFGATVFMMLMLAFITLSIQTIRSAMSNPVESLRSE